MRVLATIALSFSAGVLLCSVLPHSWWMLYFAAVLALCGGILIFFRKRWRYGKHAVLLAFSLAAAVVYFTAFAQLVQQLQAELVYCLLSNGPSPDCVLQAARLAHKHGAKIIFKPSLHSEISPELYRLTDIFVPNRLAAQHHSPCTTPEQQAEFFLAQGVKNVIITLGHRGCYLRSAEEAIWYDAPPVTAVDSTGAADAFISALAVYLLRGHSLPDATEIASHAAGFCVTKQGVIPALVDRTSLELYLSTAPQLRRT